MAHVKKTSALVYRDRFGARKEMDLSMMTEGYGEFLEELMEKLDYLIMKADKPQRRKR